MSAAFEFVNMPAELDTATVATFESALALCESEAVVFVDASDTTFMDSSGVRALITARLRQRKQGGDLFLRSPTTPVRRVIEILDLVDLIEE